MRNIKRLLREPLLHFLVLGFGLFALDALLSERRGSRADQLIEVTQLEIQWLSQGWESRWKRPPTEAELRGLVEDYVRQEVLYREALAMGLDQDDQIVRRRMVQKLEFLTEDLAAQIQPTEAELQRFFDENADDYLIPERRSFTHVYFNVDRRGETSVETAQRTLATLVAAPSTGSQAAELGDRFMLDYQYTLLSTAEVERAFGQRFAGELFELEPGEWQGPVYSGYGLHLVRVTETEEARLPNIAQVRERLLIDYGSSIRKRADEAMYQSLLTRYEVTVDEDAIRNQSLRLDTAGGGGGGGR